MNPITIIHYSYVPTKPRKAQRSPSSPKQSDTSQYKNLQQRGETSMPHGNLPKLSIEEVDKSSGASQVLCSTPEVTRSGGNQSNTICESAIARNNDIEPIVTTWETFCSSDSADHNATCKHAGLSQARSTEHFFPNADNDIDSRFGDMSYVFDEQDDGVIIEDCQIDRSEASLQHGEEPAHNCDHSVVTKDEHLKVEVRSVSPRQGVKRQADSAQKGDQIIHSRSPDSSAQGETSDETDTERVFDNRLHKKRRCSSPPSSRNSPDSFTNHASQCPQLDNDLIFDRPCQGTIIERGHDENPIVVGDFSDEDTSNESETDDCHVDEKSDDELCHSPSRYRFGPSLGKRKRDTQDYARPLYVAEVLDVRRGREFDDILGQEHIDGELYYLVKWVPTLVPSRVVRRSKAKTLISRFEARCQMPSSIKHR